MKKQDYIDHLNQYLAKKQCKVYNRTYQEAENHILIRYQSTSVVDNNVADDAMVFGVGILMLEKKSLDIHELNCQNDVEPQVNSILADIAINL